MCDVFRGTIKFFQSYCGVRQGENLSPVLFSLFLKDFEEFMQRSHCIGINLKTTQNDTDVFIKLLVLLYADTVLLGIDAESFQHNLNAFYEYSQQWKLNVNYIKTKIIIFGIRDTSNYFFKLGDNNIEICEEFKYLGVIFTKHRSFLRQLNIILIMHEKHSIYYTKEIIICISP